MPRRIPAFGLCSEQNPRFKPRNEDAAGAGWLRNRGGVTFRLAAVADGVSGLARGDEASRLAVRGLVEQLQAATFRGAEELAAQADALFARINAPIRDLSDSGSGTTLTAAVLFGRELVVLHVGDSVCYYLGRAAADSPCARKLTSEHTLVAAATSAGASDDDVAALHQHALDRCLGDPEVKPQVIVNPPEVDLTRGRLLLVTDGVSDVWGVSDLLLASGRERDLEKLCTALCTGALARPNARGKPNKDNITAVALELGASLNGMPPHGKFRYAGSAADWKTESGAPARIGAWRRWGIVVSLAILMAWAGFSWWFYATSVVYPQMMVPAPPRPNDVPPVSVSFPSGAKPPPPKLPDTGPAEFEMTLEEADKNPTGLAKRANNKLREEGYPDWEVSGEQIAADNGREPTKIQAGTKLWIKPQRKAGL